MSTVVASVAMPSATGPLENELTQFLIGSPIFSVLDVIARTNVYFVSTLSIGMSLASCAVFLQIQPIFLVRYALNLLDLVVKGQQMILSHLLQHSERL